MTPDDAGNKDASRDDSTPPALPPRPMRPTEAALQTKPTTALSSIDIQTLAFPDGSRGTFPTPSTRAVSSPIAGLSGYATLSSRSGLAGADTELDDAMSVMSLAPTLRPHGDLASLVGGEFGKKSRAWSLLRSQSASVQPFERIKISAFERLAEFETEFDDIPALGEGGATDDERLVLWKSKLKHYMILSSSGKPIYSRHGDLSLINSYMGVVQTIISFYEGAKNPLLGFTAGNARFVIVTEGPLYFVAISRLGESDAQLRGQLDALYMQILSTLTLPGLTSIFANRPSTDLRKPLQGTESLLSSLADSFTKGSPSALLGALECLKLRKSQRHAINNIFLKTRTEKLLYGLIVAGGKLVSVIRPRRHSLHPSDLQLIFNMLFESGTVRADGGENWIPLCLPAFNNRGYLYMYVSFFEAASEESSSSSSSKHSGPGAATTPPDAAGEEIAIILISPDKESFYDLKDMRDKLASQLSRHGGLSLIRAAARGGRPKVQDVVSAPTSPSSSPVVHFLYKSRANVQFVMSSLDDPSTTSASGDAGNLITRRRLMTLYHQLHAAAHARHAHLKVLHCVSHDSSSLAWVTPAFELYCVAGPNASRAALTHGANQIVQWAKKEEERLFIIGGGVF
ncbi:hypothetical protein VTK73DRAFT_4974 [Phialemonium thermophilum]|uniref:Vacuolar fusion protein MON1 n=1 Tax=Phialemonium thermophilum TaxID=223376 RepID=A0ABR3XZ63_9PEZI